MKNAVVIMRRGGSNLWWSQLEYQRLKQNRGQDFLLQSVIVETQPVAVSRHCTLLTLAAAGVG